MHEMATSVCLEGGGKRLGDSNQPEEIDVELERQRIQGAGIERSGRLEDASLVHQYVHILSLCRGAFDGGGVRKIQWNDDHSIAVFLNQWLRTFGISNRRVDLDRSLLEKLRPMPRLAPVLRTVLPSMGEFMMVGK